MPCAIDVPEPIWHDMAASVLLFGCHEAEMARMGWDEGRTASRNYHRRIIRTADSPDAVFRVSRYAWRMATPWKCCGPGSDRFAGVTSRRPHLIKCCRDNDLEREAVLAGALYPGVLSLPTERTGCWSYARSS